MGKNARVLIVATAGLAYAAVFIPLYLKPLATAPLHS